ncbi:DUF6233 domain-containing protein [Streptomyces flaveolus]|uniref:DUF6233 domain-containing protein n=1 Tax=Streptomyces flaveolus TaxID=67297 RepID=A0ABV1VTL5_9ACTN
MRDRPAPPDWLLELVLKRDSSPVQVHAGGCWNAGKRSRGTSRDEARRALVEEVEPCRACRPDSDLGLLDLGSAPSRGGHSCWVAARPD